MANTVLTYVHEGYADLRRGRAQPYDPQRLLQAPPRIHAVNDIGHLLENHGIRPTQQRIRVAQVLLAAPTHMTADQMLAVLKQSLDPNGILAPGRYGIAARGPRDAAAWRGRWAEAHADA